MKPIFKFPVVTCTNNTSTHVASDEQNAFEMHRFSRPGVLDPLDIECIVQQHIHREAFRTY